MARGTGSNAVVVFGVVLLIVGGLALAAVGAVMALAGSTSNPRHESRR